MLAQVESPQLSASLIAARAALAVAKADFDRVYGTRAETIAARKAELAAAEADVVLGKEEYDRQAHLIMTGFTPQQRVDEQQSGRGQGRSASLSDVGGEFLGLWLLAATYAGIAMLIEFSRLWHLPQLALA